MTKMVLAIVVAVAASIVLARMVNQPSVHPALQRVGHSPSMAVPLVLGIGALGTFLFMVFHEVTSEPISQVYDDRSRVYYPQPVTTYVTSNSMQVPSLLAPNRPTSSHHHLVSGASPMPSAPPLLPSAAHGLPSVPPTHPHGQPPPYSS